jgi:uncharacterized protein with PQ loop repeat
MGQETIDLATLSAIVATVLSMSCTWPQLARIRRTGDVAGVSIAAAALTVSSELGWTLYLGGKGLWSAVPEGVFNIAASGLLVVAVVRAGGSFRGAVFAASCWAAVLFGARWLGGPESIAALLAAASAIQLTPAVVTAWRTWSPSGIASVTWTLRLIESLLWAVYGLARSDPPLVVLGALGVAESSAILLRKVMTRNRPATTSLRCVLVAPSQLLDDAVVG